jgi:hypothetical protein
VSRARIRVVSRSHSRPRSRSPPHLSSYLLITRVTLFARYQTGTSGTQCSWASVATPQSFALHLAADRPLERYRSAFLTKELVLQISWEANSTFSSPYYSEPRTLCPFSTLNCIHILPLFPGSPRDKPAFCHLSYLYILFACRRLFSVSPIRVSPIRGPTALPFSQNRSSVVLVCSFGVMNQEEHSSTSASETPLSNAALQIGDPAGETTASPSRSTVPPRKRAPLASVACQDCRRRKTKVGIVFVLDSGMCHY